MKNLEEIKKCAEDLKIILAKPNILVVEESKLYVSMKIQILEWVLS